MRTTSTGCVNVRLFMGIVALDVARGKTMFHSKPQQDPYFTVMPVR